MLAGRGADDSCATLFPMDVGIFLARGLQLRHPRHRRRRILHSGTPEREQAFFSRLCETLFIAWQKLPLKACSIVLVGKWQERTGSFAAGLVGGVCADRPEFSLPGHLSPVRFCRDRRLTWRIRKIPLETISGRILPERSLLFSANPKSAYCSLFILLYRFGEAQLLGVAKLFLLDAARPGRFGADGRRIRLDLRNDRRHRAALRRLAGRLRCCAART